LKIRHTNFLKGSLTTNAQRRRGYPTIYPTIGYAVALLDTAI
jgi:hypothetical protein